MVQRLIHNWRLKLTSLVLAIGLWSHVRGEVNPWETATFRVPLDAHPPARMTVLNRDKIPVAIKVTLRAPRSRLRELKGFAPMNPLLPGEEVPPLGRDADGRMPVGARLDWTLARRGAQDVPVKAEARDDDVEVIGIKPGDIVVRLERTAKSKSSADSKLPTSLDKAAPSASTP